MAHFRRYGRALFHCRDQVVVKAPGAWPKRCETFERALSHQPFLLLTTCLTARFGFNKFNGLARRQGAAREPLLARCEMPA
jgi:hypothetical protein